MTTINKCENACYKEEDCFNIDKWFECGHYQSQRTTLLIEYCICCGNNKRIKFLPKGKRCVWCQALLNDVAIDLKREHCTNCFLREIIFYTTEHNTK